MMIYRLVAGSIISAGGQEVGSTSGGGSSDARHGAEVPSAAAPAPAPGHHVQTIHGRPSAADDHHHQARRLAASARRAPGM